MMMTSQPISPLALPPPPPRPLIVLLSATDLDSTNRFVPLLAHENLVHRRQQSPPRTRYHPYLPPASPKPIPHPRAVSSPLSSPDSSDVEDDNNESPSVDKIPCSVEAEIRIPPPQSFGSTTFKIRIFCPKAAGRSPLLQLVKWDPVQFVAIKVHFFVFTDFSH